LDISALRRNPGAIGNTVAIVVRSVAADFVPGPCASRIVGAIGIRTIGRTVSPYPGDTTSDTLRK